MKVTSRQTIEFPKFNWSISAGDTRDLPEDKEAQKHILANPAITKVKDRANTD